MPYTRIRSNTVKLISQPTQQFLSLNIIEDQVEKHFFVNSQETYYCHCQICMLNYQMEKKRRPVIKQTTSNMRITSIKMQQFLYFLSAVNSIVYCRLDLPQICFFHKSVPIRVYKSTNSGIQLISLSFPSNSSNLLPLFLNPYRSTQLPQPHRQQPKNNSMIRRGYNIKNFNRIIPSFKFTSKLQSTKCKTYLFYSNKNQQQNGQFRNISSLKSQYICVMKLQNNGVKPINSIQLRKILKSPPPNLQYIQTYISSNKKSDKIIESRYKYTKNIENEPMYKNTLLQVKKQINLINKLSHEFIFLQQLQKYQNEIKNHEQLYCQYQTYKIVHYIQLTKDIIIDKIGTLWIKNQFQQLCFFWLSYFQWEYRRQITINAGQIAELKKSIKSKQSNFQQQLINTWQKIKQKKIKSYQPSYKDQIRQNKLESIRQESILRTKQKDKQKRKKKQINQKKFYQILNHTIPY